ncbi:hypothetical protein ElyMa_006909200 [Elysia marginata]|uniref:GH18 domain-containing protein n=1 Tax=Elysia marginata TaxID=1093978 RepID=A0AAV4JJW7_9GAST|nr:hypothetical protein ElyMa_006909200 [Elysia marginata]
MGSFDGAETCELVVLFLLSKLNHLNISIGLYRDDGLAACKLSPKQAETTKKEMCKISNEYNLNNLDISLDLENDMYMPYHKPSNNTT